MHEHWINIAEAFSRKSFQYDDFGNDHQNLEYMRHTVRTHVLKYLKPGDRILEINAGTGDDALFSHRMAIISMRPICPRYDRTNSK
jgi:ubiquinone/menaquinone biosynthesis C-methylase UbiE